MATTPAADWLTLQDRLQGDAQTAFSQAITYRPTGNPATVMRGMFLSEHEVVELQGGAEVSATRPVLEVKNSELSEPVKQGFLFDIAGTSYEVTDVQDDGRGSSKIILMVT